MKSSEELMIWPLAVDLCSTPFIMCRVLILQAGFTPTDALHVLGHFDRWNREASTLGAELLASQTTLSPEALCQQVVSGVSDRIAAELVSKILSKEATLPNWDREPAAVALLTRAFDGSHCSELDCQLTLKQPIIAIGAPVEAYLPRTAKQLHTEPIIPDRADVANAVGAVAGGVIQRMCVLVHHLEDLSRSVFRFYLPDGNCDFDDLEEGVAYAQKAISVQLEAMAHDAGADHVEVTMVREDKYVPFGEGTEDELYLSTELTFTAIGRPSLDREKKT